VRLNPFREANDSTAATPGDRGRWNHIQFTPCRPEVIGDNPGVVLDQFLIEVHPGPLVMHLLAVSTHHYPGSIPNSSTALFINRQIGNK
jgi:hypothetical protein